MSKYAFLLKLLDRLANCLDDPKEKYLVDTIDLMRYLLLNRPDMSERQITIIHLIIECCETGLEKFNYNEEQ